MKTVNFKNTAAGIVLLLLSVQLSFAEGITFQENKTWKELLAIAKKEHKILFLDAYATWCGPCKYLQNNVFTEGSVATYFNANFINAAIDMEKGEGPTIAEEFGVTAYPTLFFIDGDGKLLHKYVGALDAQELIDLGKDASDPAKQFYTVKANAGKLSPAALLEWASTAERMEDADAKQIITDYVNTPSRNWLDKNVLTLAFDHAGALTEERMNYVLQHKAEIKKLLELTDEEFTDYFTRKSVSLALDKSYTGDVLNIEIFKSTLTKYVPEKAELETRKMKIKYAFLKKEDDKGISELLALLTAGNALKLSIFNVASITLDNAEAIAASDQAAAVIDKIKAYKLLPEDAEKVYYQDFAMLSIYYYKEDKVKMKELAERIKATPGTPDNILSLSDKILGSAD